METLKKLPLSVILAFAFLSGMWVVGLIFATPVFLVVTIFIGVFASIVRISYYFTFNK